MLTSPAVTVWSGFLLVAAVASPVVRNWQERPRDDFPLSHYPMFSSKRKRHGHVVHLLATSGTVESNVPYHRIGTGGFNQVRRQIARRASTEVGAQHLAEEALELLRHTDPSITRVRVVRSTFNYDEFFAGNRTPTRVREIATAATEEI